jgi:5-formyltetrahydrofolate cyclo-ligase
MTEAPVTIFGARARERLQTWEEIRAWRKAERQTLLASRVHIPHQERLRRGAIVSAHAAKLLPPPENSIIGFYWPYRGEFDARPLVRRMIRHGARAALPVVVERRQPVEFWEWRPRMPLDRGIWNIPIPAMRSVVRPTVLLVPLLGFDGEGFRLGYGGGYYDRTLAALDPKPAAIGVGYEIMRLDTIYPQPHDVPMDAIVTEAGVFEVTEGALRRHDG